MFLFVLYEFVDVLEKTKLIPWDFLGISHCLPNFTELPA
jgi:hypothetical protein